jgi:hypothetical protein
MSIGSLLERNFNSTICREEILWSQRYFRHHVGSFPRPRLRGYDLETGPDEENMQSLRPACCPQTGAAHERENRSCNRSQRRTVKLRDSGEARCGSDRGWSIAKNSIAIQQFFVCRPARSDFIGAGRNRRDRQLPFPLSHKLSWRSTFHFHIEDVQFRGLRLTGIATHAVYIRG